MVSADGFTKVLDFGLAKLTEKRDAAASDIAEDATLARDGSAVGSVVGTAGYMSPEQVQGKAVDHRSDIFSFGCILYEAATRKKPFAAETGIETMHKILNEKPVPVEELNDKVPAELRRLVKRCLAKSPDQRVQSIKDLAIELREIAEEYDSLSASASSTTHASGTAVRSEAARRSRKPSSRPSALLGLGVIAVGWWGLRRGAAGSGTPRPAFQSMRMSTQTSRGDVFEAALSPDGRYLAYLAGVAGRASLRVRQVATGSDVEVLPDAGHLARGPGLLARRELPLLPRAQARQPELPGALRGRLARRHPARARLRRRLAVELLAGREAHRVLAARSTRRSRAGSSSLELESSKEHVLASRLRPRVVPGRAELVARRPHDRRGAPEAGARLPGDGLALRQRERRAARPARRFPARSSTASRGCRTARGSRRARRTSRTSINQQVYLIGYPDAQLQRVTNDFYRYAGVSVSRGEEAIAAVRVSRLANLWIADAAAADRRGRSRRP